MASQISDPNTSNAVKKKIQEVIGLIRKGKLGAEEARAMSRGLQLMLQTIDLELKHARLELAEARKFHAQLRKQIKDSY